jgi:hypothetical protein
MVTSFKKSALGFFKRVWFTILLMFLGAVMLFVGRTSTKPETVLPGCQNNHGVCVDQADCDDLKPQTPQPPCEARIGHSLRLHVQNPPGPKENISRLVLFLNGVALKGVNALPTGEPGWFRFYLRYEPGSEVAWKTLLHEPKFWDRDKTIVRVSLGVEDSVAYDTAVRIRLGYYDGLWLWIWWASSLATLSLIWHFRAALLKVPVNFAAQTKGELAPAGSKVSKYSLARVQLAFWFFLILSGYLFVCWMTWELKLLNATLIGLLGVSGGTAIGSAIVDKNKFVQQRSDALELARLQQQGVSLNLVDQTRIEQLESDAKLRKERVDQRRGADAFSSFVCDTLSHEDSDASKVGIYRLWNRLWIWLWTWFQRFSLFVSDILSDEDSVAGKVEIYRLQNALWTLFLGITFVRVIWNTLALPDFDSNLVLLTGVSSLTFVGLKNSK